ncbi:MAG TPA: zinc-dependent alcohol dehydrogenase family protein [Paenibacillus sp.]|uniref:zinc-dependent alcohol dehydrogenase family protein n=1 Tax=Paenibacillus sp. TaxID=58172 RepID=UPI0028D535F2|nr:zinc-dependent alcohol dehydrogenase family protein [Paenibacillus sp.]HUC91888.1 zinc-dependent alcohol dehydrogenase family protein [Paenibacillus sp.]
MTDRMMKALVVEEPHKAVVKQVPYPKPGPNEVTIKVDSVGICGTDVHIFEGDFISAYPIIPGHEFSGTIHEWGEAVTGWKIGEPVSADPSLFCGSCRFCLTNRGNHCENWGALGNTTSGSMAEYVKVPVKNVVRMPEGMSFSEAAFIEPLACVVHGMNRLQVKAGDRVILFGAGAMGQQLVQAIARSGASELVVVDVSQQKLDMACRYGATKGVLSRNLDEELSRENYPYGFDIVVDVTGIPAVIQQAFDYMGPTAKFLQFGVTPENAKVQVSPFRIYHKDWTIIGSMAINNTFIPAYHWLKDGRIEVNHLVSKQISLEETVDFFNSPRDPNHLKIQIKI